MSRNKDLKRSMLDEMLQPRKQQKVTIVPGKCLQDGQRALNEKRFQAAINHLTQALSSKLESKHDTLLSHELRARAHIQMAQNELALHDAKVILRTDATDPRGYLLCAQIEQLRSRWAAATKICQAGLLRILKSDNRAHIKLEALQKRIDHAAQRRIILKKGTDPMLALPPELLAMVLDGFDYRQSVAAMRVSKTWRDHLRSSNLLRRTIDTRMTKSVVTYSQIKVMFARLSKEPQSLAFARLNDTTSRLVVNELRHWIRWESLQELVVAESKLDMKQIRWEKFQSLRRLQFGAEVKLPCKIVNIIAAVPSLKSLKVTDSILAKDENINLAAIDTSSQLQEISLFPKASTNPAVVSVCALPSLEVLELSQLILNGDLRLSECTKLKRLRLAFSSVAYPVMGEANFAIQTPATLKSLSLEHNFYERCLLRYSFNDPTIAGSPAEWVVPVDSLTILKLHGVESIPCLVRLFAQDNHRRTLEALSLSDFSTTDGSTYAALSKAELLRSGVFGGVQTLLLDDIHLCQKSMTYVWKLFPNIVDLTLGLSRLTEAAISDFIRAKGPFLRYLSIRCGTQWDFTDPNFIPWARSQGVEVKIIRDTEADRSRRIRYE